MHQDRARPLGGWLARQSPAVFSAYAIGAAFVTYFCMYAFRKPFTAATFEGHVGDVDLKIALVISQTIGYAISKYLGIKFCSEIAPARRALAIVALIVWAEAALVLFGLAPPAWQVAFIFLNGLPLGMVWGMVVGFLEGRQTSELLLAGLSCSYIVASGFVKDRGNNVMSWGVSEDWMPAVTGLMFLPALLVAVWMLDQLPHPTREDMALRVEREPMQRAARRAFVRQFLGGLVVLFAVYFVLTAYRDFRDSFQIEIFKSIGYGDVPDIFTKTELPVALGVMAALAALNLIRDNRRGLMGAFAIMIAGTIILGASTLLFDAGRISGYAWMIAVGLGVYLAYVPFGSVLFDRVIASTRTVGTAVFAIYLADSIGYTGSVGILLVKNFSAAHLSYVDLFRGLSYFLSLFGTLGLIASCLYFVRKAKQS